MQSSCRSEAVWVSSAAAAALLVAPCPPPRAPAMSRVKRALAAFPMKLKGYLLKSKTSGSRAASSAAMYSLTERSEVSIFVAVFSIKIKTLVHLTAQLRETRLKREGEGADPRREGLSAGA